MDTIQKLAKKYPKWWIGALTGLAVVAYFFISSSPGCSNNDTKDRVLAYVRQNAVKAMTKSDNLVMRETGNNIATAGALSGLFSALDPKNPTSQALGQLGKNPDVKLVFDSITETQRDGSNHTCQTTIQMSVPSLMKMPPQSGSVSFRYTVRPNLADTSKGSVINIYW